MKIARYSAYGGPETVVLEDAPIPTPGPGELLIRTRAAPVTAGDARMRSGKVPRGLSLMVRLALGWSHCCRHFRATLASLMMARAGP